MIVWIDHKVPHHLSRFRVLDVDVLLLAHWLHEILMHQFPDLSPCLAIIHEEEVITLSDQSSHDGSRSVAVNVTFLVEQIFDKLPVGYDEGGIGESLQTEDSPEFSRPFGQSDDVCKIQHPLCPKPNPEKGRGKYCNSQEMAISRRNLMFVAQNRHSPRP